MVLSIVARPLLFASLDPAVAAARGVPTRLLSIGFLVLLAVAAGEAAPGHGALVFALFVVPPAVAQTLTPRPGVSMAMSVAVGLLVVWVWPLFVAYYSPYPSGSS